MIDILYEDKDIIVVRKPAGMESQESRGFGADMVSELKKHLAKEGSEPYVGVVHRLDKPVAGVMVYAKTRQAAAGLSKQFAEAGHAGKIYEAVCMGAPEKAHIRLENMVDFDKKTNTSWICREPYPDGAKTALLEADLVKAGKYSEICAVTHLGRELDRCLSSGKINEDTTLSVLKVRLFTGRHHQIRLQLSGAGLPILGDTKYNEVFKNYRGLSALCLMAVRLEFKHPVTGKNMVFTV